ncbi:Vacuolar protein sorting-associated protein 20 [Yamadazyma tenuis]|uniref:Snf7-domain-containing protein n=1 Tax=Candida tenuis (strain ATCC 10573 / BCRC 21748 / CBS 615 / JCM 9827 / NBRC 10315 / NRRL Y-1498 / VKM Y-70) TaxID=590646 RepID=G3BFQ3_CANTC|nr:uncharacterized protein CANTEDRAFT_116102 [Yamadazyma tenuis ATCC 10573]EGV60078.1 hypothetical protein CANTEDRAFT_116102 [Yamadazyma tenuis ATCC 10573]WEJ94690.1 Vacuolar protein sorting-associated protein 20 [Yamadazyma tenuis]
MGQQPSTPKITAQDRAIFQMKQQRDKLKQYQKRLNVVVLRQTNLAKEALSKGDKERALFYLRSKKQQQSVISKTYEQLDNLENLIGTIEFKLIEKDVVYGLTQGNQVLQKLNTEMSVDKIDKLMDEVEDERLKVDEVSEILGTKNALSNSEELEVDEEFERMDREINGTVQLPDVANDTHKVSFPETPSTELEPEEAQKEEQQNTPNEPLVA